MIALAVLLLLGVLGFLVLAILLCEHRLARIQKLLERVVAGAGERGSVPAGPQAVPQPANAIPEIFA